MNEKICPVCGKQFLPASHRGVYCSEKCLRKVWREKMMKKLSARVNRMHGIQHQVYWAYDYKCAICGWQLSGGNILKLNGKIQHSRGNEIHHIIPVSEGGDESWQNLILLCPNHHKMADLGVLARDELKLLARPYMPTEQKEIEMRSSAARAVAKTIFGEEETCDE